MRVQIVRPGAQPERGRSAPDAAIAGPWRPGAIVGAPAPGGLQLPSASPSATTLYAPRGVYVDEEFLVVADTGNHRVLIFDGNPEQDGAAADVVLGQPDERSEGPNVGGAEYGLNLPTGVLVSDGRLVVADAWNHRILIWDEVPTTGKRRPDLVLGQESLSSVEPNAGGSPTASSFYWPFGIAVVAGRFYVADTGNRRVLCWPGGLPSSSEPASVVLGQDDERSRAENRGATAAPDSFRWPHAICAAGADGILVADAGNHRVLGWNHQPIADTYADFVLGQPDLFSAAEFPYQAQEPNRFRFPYSVANLDDGLAVADTANNRILLWNERPADPSRGADHVLGQHSYLTNGENRWESVSRDTLCWPYGLAASGSTLAVADSGNNRVVLWRRS